MKITVIFADSQSDCSKNMPPSNMRYIAASLTNQIADILCVDDKIGYDELFDITILERKGPRDICGL